MGKHFMHYITAARVNATQVSRWNRVGSCMRLSSFNVYPKCVQHYCSRAAYVNNYITCMFTPIIQYTLKATAPISHTTIHREVILSFGSIDKSFEVWFWHLHYKSLSNHRPSLDCLLFLLTPVSLTWYRIFIMYQFF